MGTSSWMGWAWERKSLHPGAGGLRSGEGAGAAHLQAAVIEGPGDDGPAVLQLEGDQPLPLGGQDEAGGDILGALPGAVLPQAVDLDIEGQVLLRGLEGEGCGVILGQFIGLQQTLR